MPCFRCTTPAHCDRWGCTPGTFPSEKTDPHPQPLTPEQQATLDAVPLRQPGPFDLAFNTATSTTSTAALTALQLNALEKLLVRFGPEPIGEWMREHGFPPETSLLLLPERVRASPPAYAWPQYVRFSPSVSEPVLVQDVLRTEWGVWRYRK